ncbi:hypothetical protein GCM10011396_55100 [Undibacterium terreum]|uniref:Uncharacterized protein n=1 Tax=Undibacterium terreum TaxID=1224302 RepID=A0A916V0Y5_9BURK|nr:hypothetical protein GCM10011396_55100 [Undibacterium terreum]
MVRSLALEVVELVTRDATKSTSNMRRLHGPIEACLEIPEADKLARMSLQNIPNMASTS